MSEFIKEQALMREERERERTRASRRNWQGCGFRPPGVERGTATAKRHWTGQSNELYVGHVRIRTAKLNSARVVC